MHRTPPSRAIFSIILLVGILINAYLIYATLSPAGYMGLIVKVLTLTVSGLAAAFIILWIIADTKSITWQYQLEHCAQRLPTMDVEEVKDAADEALDYQLKAYATTFVANIKHVTENMSPDDVMEQAGELPPGGKQVLEAVMDDQPLDQIIDQFDTPEAALSALMLTSGAVIQLLPNPKTARV